MKAVRGAKPARPTVSAELSAAIRGELRRALGAATRRAVVLQSIATQVASVTTEAFVDASPEQHRQRAHELRGMVLHGFTVLMELEHINGCLETLARMEETLNDATAD